MLTASLGGTPSLCSSAHAHVVLFPAPIGQKQHGEGGHIVHAEQRSCCDDPHEQENGVPLQSSACTARAQGKLAMLCPTDGAHVAFCAGLSFTRPCTGATFRLWQCCWGTMQAPMCRTSRCAPARAFPVCPCSLSDTLCAGHVMKAVCGLCSNARHSSSLLRSCGAICTSPSLAMSSRGALGRTTSWAPAQPRCMTCHSDSTLSRAAPLSASRLPSITAALS